MINRSVVDSTESRNFDDNNNDDGRESKERVFKAEELKYGKEE